MFFIIQGGYLKMKQASRQQIQHGPPEMPFFVNWLLEKTKFDADFRKKLILKDEPHSYFGFVY